MECRAGHDRRVQRLRDPARPDRPCGSRGWAPPERPQRAAHRRTHGGRPADRHGRLASVGYGPNAESDAWNIGIALIPEARGRGHGTEAQARLADYLFANTTVNRVEAQTDTENVAEQRALEKAGFRREGVARGSQFRAGAYHDLVSYSMLRGDVKD